MSDDTPEAAIERGLEAYFAGETVTDLLDGIDIDALAAGAPLDDAVEYEQLGTALDALIGRTAIKRVSNNGLLGRFFKESLGSEVGGRVGEALVATLAERADVEALTEQMQGLTATGQLDRLTEQASDTIAESGVEELGGGTADEPDWTDIDVEERDE